MHCNHQRQRPAFLCFVILLFSSIIFNFGFMTSAWAVEPGSEIETPLESTPTVHISDIGSLSSSVSCASMVVDTQPQFVFSAERSGGFLTDSSNDSRELFRRLGRQLGELDGKWIDNHFTIAGFAASGNPDKPIMSAVLDQSEWNAEQKTGVANSLKRVEDLLASMAADVPVPTKGMYLKGIVEPEQVGKFVSGFIEHQRSNRQLSQVQLSKVRENLLPLLKLVDKVAILGSLADDGFKLRLRIIGEKNSKGVFESLSKAAGDSKCAAFIDPDALLNVAQVYSPPQPGAVMEQLHRIPQMAVVEGYLASVGLDLEKDILPTHSPDSLVTLSLNPIGEGGLPDVRMISRVANTVSLLAMAPKLKQLATNLGIFVSVSTDGSFPDVRVSYFLFPSFGIHVTLEGEFLALATGRENLGAAVNRIRDVTGGKIPAFRIPDAVQRYWRISFQRLNEQLQSFLQSPLLASRGIPPISNITIARELGDLVLYTRMLPDQIEINVDVPLQVISSKK
ncbi:MAG: hypothetical protein HQM09_18515 [Candidatus Riflebacteria bacterium]|nr:hypothetical protein [Candidatus Riflebacteria bacterium]